MIFLHLMDVKTAYLNASIDCEVYMDQAEGFEVPSGSGGTPVYKLNKLLYGLRQSVTVSWRTAFFKALLTIVCIPIVWISCYACLGRRHNYSGKQYVVNV